jgi:hypothetical protein
MAEGGPVHGIQHDLLGLAGHRLPGVPHHWTVISQVAGPLGGAGQLTLGIVRQTVQYRPTLL